MRYTLKDYQADAVGDVLSNLRKARRNYEMDGDLSQFSLSASTGAGKTVMAAAVIEALFFGSDEFDFEADPGAVVLWFSDDPALNQQSRARIQAAASELDSRLRVVETTFSEPMLRPGNVYFLNMQKLAKTSRLVRGAQHSGPDQDRLFEARPDEVQSNFYDVLRNTIGNSELNLYFVLDEAHKGMGVTTRARAERQTIVQGLINGVYGAPPMPIVFGISATVERFQEAMSEAKGRDTLTPVTVDSASVQESGLLKDDIILSIPDEVGKYDTVLLRRAVGKIRKSSQAWVQYAVEQGDVEPVVPLLVVQMGDKATTEDMTMIIDTVFEHWPDLSANSFAHVYGEHQDLLIGNIPLPYIEPQRVQDQKSVRVLLAKTAISTGWDCPRAEVLVSFRPAADKTHITQLMGRMMRTPLARRIPGNELLNSVDCLLPFFDRKTSTQVAQMLMKGQSSGDDLELGASSEYDGRRVLFSPVTVTRNPAIDEAVWELFAGLPTVTIPKKNVKPIKRLTALATVLSKDQLVEEAVAKAHMHLNAALDGRSVQYAVKVEKARKDVMTMKGYETRGRLGGGMSTRSFEENSDPRAIEASYRAATRVLSPALCTEYVNHLVPDEDDYDGLLEANITVAALGLVPEIVKDIEDEADKLARKWLTESRVERKRLPDDRQADYDRLEGQSTKPERISLLTPEVGQVESMERLPNGEEKPLPTMMMHLLATEDGEYPVDLNQWETKVVKTESRRPGFKGWYRNPARSSKESLAVAYKEVSGDWKALRPDFVFFSSDHIGNIRADLVDPHGHHLSDALPKLSGLADFAEAYGEEFNRIESVAETRGTMRVLDLTQEHVREAIRQSTNAKALYESDVAHDY